MKYILAIDQGTTSSRAILFNKEMKIEATSQEEFPQYFPNSGWVEHNPNDLFQTVINSCKNVLKEANATIEDIVSIGITNQRETTVVWDKHTGEAVYNAIVWQDRRTAKECNEFKKDGHEKMIMEKTGLLFDPYFSGMKLRWILENVEGAKQKALNGDLLFGTVDSFLIWKLSNKQNHVTDATNAARTMIFNIKTNEWDKEICSLLDIPMNILPEVKDCADDFASVHKDFFGKEIPINGVAGDQQSALVGQACFEPGMAKSTYGTGCFAILNLGENMVVSKNRLLTTIGYRLNGKTTYALEGSIFIAGAVVQWLRDGLKIIEEASNAQEMALNADENQQLYLVPAFTGLGAPYWDMECRGAIYGLTRGSGPNEFAKAALESVAYQTRDLIEAMFDDWNSFEKSNSNKKSVLRIDGGMSSSNYTMQFLSDMLAMAVDRPEILETTALGVAWLAGMKAGFYPNEEGFSDSWKLERKFEPSMDEEKREILYDGWKDAVQRTLS
ncbi:MULTISPECIES: glycerol kinase GlpK [Arcobacteraceae]|uniref:Glycerol kinase n=1 Tax=Poseidonibacter parvus TaxID=1850254 RepID=A0A1P8KMQ4_9BACT|nr:MULTISPECIES: glycerol kinase GlpK [Arcobacteraceae]APW65805.1 glycerol kinase [Poseidonibacter parvus]